MDSSLLTMSKKFEGQKMNSCVCSYCVCPAIHTVLLCSVRTKHIICVCTSYCVFECMCVVGLIIIIIIIINMFCCINYTEYANNSRLTVYSTCVFYTISKLLQSDSYQTVDGIWIYCNVI